MMIVTHLLVCLRKDVATEVFADGLDTVELLGGRTLELDALRQQFLVGFAAIINGKRPGWRFADVFRQLAGALLASFPRLL